MNSQTQTSTKPLSRQDRREAMLVQLNTAGAQLADLFTKLRTASLAEGPLPLPVASDIKLAQEGARRELEGSIELIGQYVAGGTPQQEVLASLKMVTRDFCASRLAKPEVKKEELSHTLHHLELALTTGLPEIKDAVRDYVHA